MNAFAPAHARAPQDDIAAQHWQGGPIRCGECDYANLRALDDTQGCEPGYACMQDVYARRIDRFFRWHPELSDAQLNHAYFEVRAIAARRASVFRLTALMDDPDETVRLQVALRLPQAQLVRLARDAHREVRRVVAERLPVAMLPRLTRDTDWRVRWEVAQRADAATLESMRDDEEPEVRQTVQAHQARAVSVIGETNG
jgi:hypothetical protein